MGASPSLFGRAGCRVPGDPGLVSWLWVPIRLGQPSWHVAGPGATVPVLLGNSMLEPRCKLAWGLCTRGHPCQEATRSGRDGRQASRPEAVATAGALLWGISRNPGTMVPTGMRKSWGASDEYCSMTLLRADSILRARGRTAYQVGNSDRIGQLWTSPGPGKRNDTTWHHTHEPTEAWRPQSDGSREKTFPWPCRSLPLTALGP